MKYTDYDEFYEKVGILDEERLEEIGWPNVDNGNRICTSRLNELVEFVEKLNTTTLRFVKGDKAKKYHIATDLSPDNLEGEYCEEQGIDPEDENRRVVATSITNRIALVNRMDYFLCDGDDNEELFLEHVEEV